MRTAGQIPSRRPVSAAYTLVEVLVAVALIGIMVISLYAGFSSGFEVLRAAREKSRATQILLQRIEAIRFCTWSQLPSLATTFQEPFNPLATNPDSHSTFYWGSISVDAPEGIPDDADYKSNVRQVTVAVCWTNFNGSVPIICSNQITTLVARYGAQNYMLGGKR
jgi:prepilin-type N-terminal cleavage/methylation domain-containing protein